MVRTLLHRAETIITRESDRKEEITHVKSVLRANGYKEWAMKIPKPKPKQPASEKQTQRGRPSVALPYIRGLSEKLTHIFRQHGVGTYHKPFNTLISLLVHLKDKTPTLNKCGVVYKIEFPGCPQIYIGETGRGLATRMKEHTRKSAPFTAIGEHCNDTKHNISAECISVVAREANLWRCKIRESIEI